MTAKIIAILGSTGSIGRSTVEIVKSAPDQFEIDLLVAGSNATELAEQIRTFKPKVAGLSDRSKFEALCGQLGVAINSGVFEGTRLIGGDDEIVAAVKESQASIVVAAVVGMAGLAGVVAALESGKDVALANKESLVVAGALVVDLAKKHGVSLLPVDSEHSAIFQCLRGIPSGDIESVVLTASGGPFLKTPFSQFRSITPEQAVKHPKWNMGAKISVDSSTLMNKALEVIEAKWLFNLETERIEVVVHPQSIIHSMVRLTDGGLLAQLSVPDMKGPIAYALTFPDKRLKGVIPRLDFNQLSGLSFEPVDHQRFPSVRMAIECLNGSKGAAAVFNTANEVAVSRFLGHEVGYLDIFRIVEGALERFGSSDYINLSDLNNLCREVAEWSRQMTRSA